MRFEERQVKEEWAEAVDLLCRWERAEGHLDDLLEGVDLGRMRWLVMEAFRKWPVIEQILAPRLSRQPRPRVHQLLRLAVAECLYREADLHPRIVHNAVEASRWLKLSKAEGGFVNGVLRSILRTHGAFEHSLGATHPAWLVTRWEQQFGKESAKRLLEWNQSIPLITIRGKSRPRYADPTEWEGFYRIIRAQFSEAYGDLQAGTVYAQDPFTRLPLELLAVQPGEKVMDLCAAPGGKTRMLVEAMGGKGHLVAVDKPGKRLDRLSGNLKLIGDDFTKIVGSLVEDLKPEQLPEGMELGSLDAVLLDVPCSNTGVIQKRPDVKLRVKESDIIQLAEAQRRLLKHAAEWVRPGGRLVYSTCSLEREENEDVVESFCKEHPEWNLEKSILSHPWKCHHDGGGAFLLTKRETG